MRILFLLSALILSISVIAQNQKAAVSFLSCSDIGAENGWSGWQASTGEYSLGIITYNVINISPTLAPNRFVLTGSAGIDACTPGPAIGSPVIPVVAPGFGKASIRLGERLTNGADGGCGMSGPAAGCVERLTYTFTVTNTDTNFLYSYAVILENPPNVHLAKDVPYVEMYILDQGGKIIPASHQKYTGDTTNTVPPGSYWGACSTPASGMDVVYKPWSTVGVNLSAYLGMSLTVVIVNADCALGGHFCHSYWDFSCSIMNLNSSSDPDTCSAGNGTATVSVFGGTVPYTYLWSNGQSTKTATGLSSGVYTVTVTDAGNLTASTVAAVGNYPIVPVASSVKPVSCFGGNDGAATVTASGGIPPFTYLWSNGKTTQSITGLTAGPYSVVVTDDVSCSAKLSVVVPGASMLVAKLNSTPASCSTCSDGSVQVNVTGGSSPYTYQWNTLQTTPVITGITPGSYTVCVTDTNACQVCDAADVWWGVGVNELLSNNSFSIYPNPSSESIFIDFGSKDFGKADITFSDLTGRILDKKFIHANEKQMVNVSGFSNGTYLVRLHTEYGAVTKKIVVYKGHL